MASEIIEKLRQTVRDVPDFPKKGIVFKDITPILGDGELFGRRSIFSWSAARERRSTRSLELTPGGFLFGSAVTCRAGDWLCAVAQRRAVTHKTESAAYTLEYGEAGKWSCMWTPLRRAKIVLIDDLLATDGDICISRYPDQESGRRFSGSNFSDRIGIPARSKKTGTGKSLLVLEILTSMQRRFGPNRCPDRNGPGRLGPKDLSCTGDAFRPAAARGPSFRSG